MNRNVEVKREPEAPVELESQFILRLPEVGLFCQNICTYYLMNLVKMILRFLK